MPFPQGPTSVSERRLAFSAEVHCKPLHPQMSRIHNENVSYTQSGFTACIQQNFSRESEEEVASSARRTRNSSDTMAKNTWSVPNTQSVTKRCEANAIGILKPCTSAPFSRERRRTKFLSATASICVPGFTSKAAKSAIIPLSAWIGSPIRRRRKASPSRVFTASSSDSPGVGCAEPGIGLP